MFIGHHAVGFAAKRFAPRASLGALMAAPLLADLLWPVFLLVGREHVRLVPGLMKFSPFDLYDFPYSHSLLMLVVWATLFALGYYLRTRYRAGAIAIWLGVVSHWPLDWITHRPDMPLYPGSARYGLGLWNSIPGTVVIEAALFAVGLWLYVRTTRPADAIGRYAFWAFAALLALAYAGNALAPQSVPPSVTALAVFSLVMGLLQVPWAWWFDRHRRISATD
ncbi:MAG TPA: metal-dependent hydrolase [Pyrinomonadaceae bacterium]|jgi:membrane-bound metal-dependent hydrolase YbcI (DUF457 family)